MRADINLQVSFVATERGYLDAKGVYSPACYSLQAAPVDDRGEARCLNS